MWMHSAVQQSPCQPCTTLLVSLQQVHCRVHNTDMPLPAGKEEHATVVPAYSHQSARYLGILVARLQTLASEWNFTHLSIILTTTLVDSSKHALDLCTSCPYPSWKSLLTQLTSKQLLQHVKEPTNASLPQPSWLALSQRVASTSGYSQGNSCSCDDSSFSQHVGFMLPYPHCGFPSWVSGLHAGSNTDNTHACS